MQKLIGYVFTTSLLNELSVLGLKPTQTYESKSSSFVAYEFSLAVSGGGTLNFEIRQIKDEVSYLTEMNKKDFHPFLQDLESQAQASFLVSSNASFARLSDSNMNSTTKSNDSQGASLFEVLGVIQVNDEDASESAVESAGGFKSLIQPDLVQYLKVRKNSSVLGLLLKCKQSQVDLLSRIESLISVGGHQYYHLHTGTSCFDFVFTE